VQYTRVEGRDIRTVGAFAWHGCTFLALRLLADYNVRFERGVSIWIWATGMMSEKAIESFVAAIES
jgi:hypothetical protein